MTTRRCDTWRAPRAGSSPAPRDCCGGRCASWRPTGACRRRRCCARTRRARSRSSVVISVPMVETLAAWPLTNASAASTPIVSAISLLELAVQRRIAGDHAARRDRGAVAVDGGLRRLDQIGMLAEAEVVAPGEVEARACRRSASGGPAGPSVERKNGFSMPSSLPRF